MNSSAIADASALRQLRQPEVFAGLPLRHEWDRQLLIWQEDLAHHQSWALYREVQHQRFVVRRIRFDRLETARHLWPENPHLHGAEGHLDEEAGVQLLTSLERLVLPPLRRNTDIVLDGTLRGLEFGSCSFEWRQAPREWADLQDLFIRLQERFDAVLPRQTGAD